MKYVDVKNNTYTDFDKKVMIKILNLKLVAMQEYQNIKINLLKDILQIGVKITKVKITVQNPFFS